MALIDWRYGRVWRSILEHFGIAFDGDARPGLARATMPGAQWFPGVQLNYVEQVFRLALADRPAILTGDESGRLVEVKWVELRRRVGALTATLRAHGVQRGDRVAAYLPNTADTVAAFLATASIAAIWSLCSPDMGAASVVDLGRPSYMPLFVVLREGMPPDEVLQGRITAATRKALSPKHVPNAIIAVPAILRALSGKKLEVPIKRLLLGEPLSRVVKADAVANPLSLDWYVEFARNRNVAQ